MTHTGELQAEKGVFFDPKEHSYRIDGKLVPSVTQVLGEWFYVVLKDSGFYISALDGQMIPAVAMEQARQAGNLIHDKAEKIAKQEDPDWGNMNDITVGASMQFEQWLEDYKVRILDSEMRVFSRELMVAGTLDLACEIDKYYETCMKDGRVIVDVKTGKHNELTGAQIAGYEKLYRETEKYEGKIYRFELYLPRDPSEPYEFKQLTNQGDYNYFLNRLYQWRYLNKNGKRFKRTAELNF